MKILNGIALNRPSALLCTTSATSLTMSLCAIEAIICLILLDLAIQTFLHESLSSQALNYGNPSSGWLSNLTVSGLKRAKCHHGCSSAIADGALHFATARR